MLLVPDVDYQTYSLVHKESRNTSKSFLSLLIYSTSPVPQIPGEPLLFSISDWASEMFREA